MNARRLFVVATSTAYEFVSARSVRDALRRAHVPRKSVVAVFDETALIDCRGAAAEMSGAPLVVIIGRAPAPQPLAQFSIR